MKDSLGDRMKRYESVSQSHLSKRLPVIIRIDGKAFHTLTRNMEKPFDDNLISCMQNTTKQLVKNIDGCKFAYTQSDEISLLLTDYETIATDAWFDYNVQKLVSVSASIATVVFKSNFESFFGDFSSMTCFDSRVFTLPKEEVVNYFIWRQQDYTRNSIQMIGRSKFSHKELHKKSCDDIQEMLFQQCGINYNDIETHKKRGTCVYYKESNYVVDKEIPIFTQDRKYIQDFVDVEI